MFALIIISIFSTIFLGEDSLAILLACIPYIVIFCLCSGFANLVLHIFLLVYYYKGLTGGDFLDWYKNCLGDNSKYSSAELKDGYDKLDEIDSNITVFIILNSVGIALNYIGSCFIKTKKEF